MTASPTRYDASHADAWRFGPVGHSDARRGADRGTNRSDPYTDGLVARVARACDGQRPTPLALRLNLHPETVRRYLNGQRPSPEFLAALCRELGVSAEWLLLGEGEMHRPGQG